MSPQETYFPCLQVFSAHPASPETLNFAPYPFVFNDAFMMQFRVFCDAPQRYTHDICV